MCIDPAPTRDPFAYIAGLEAQLIEGAETLGRERRMFLAQIAAMQPVVDAACAWVDTDEPAIEECEVLTAAVTTYRTAAQPPAEQGKADGS